MRHLYQFVVIYKSLFFEVTDLNCGEIRRLLLITALFLALHDTEWDLGMRVTPPPRIDHGFLAMRRGPPLLFCLSIAIEHKILSFFLIQYIFLISVNQYILHKEGLLSLFKIMFFYHLDTPPFFFVFKFSQLPLGLKIGKMRACNNNCFLSDL